MLLLELYSCILIFAFGQTTAIDNENTCYNRFEYEYNVLRKLIWLEMENSNMTSTVENLFQAVATLSQTIQGLAHVSGQYSGGSIYTRWGRKSCPNNTNAELVYEGYAGGAHFEHTGSGTNYLCLPRSPIYGEDFSSGDRGYLYGVEYQIPVITGIFNNDAPCAVCRVPETTVLMIPGRNQCYPNWKLEYDGFLVSERHSHTGSKEFVCMDGQPEALNSGSADENGALFYLVNGRCGSLKCPPYDEDHEITCAVCSYAPNQTNSLP